MLEHIKRQQIAHYHQTVFFWKGSRWVLHANYMRPLEGRAPEELIEQTKVNQRRFTHLLGEGKTEC